MTLLWGGLGRSGTAAGAAAAVLLSATAAQADVEPSATPRAGQVEAASAFGDRAVKEANKWRGTPYAWAGGSYSGPTNGGFDSSGLVMRVIYKASKGKTKLPHSSDAQARKGSKVTWSGRKPGDVIAFKIGGGSTYDHVGIYVSKNKMISAVRAGTNVRTDSLDTAYWSKWPKTVRRFS